MTNEIWKDVEEYKGLYQVSNRGRVKRLAQPKNPFRRDERILKSHIHTKGYEKVSFVRNGTQKIFYVHRLVAQAFIPNPNNYPQVNHKDENKLNNNVENLEWCTNRYNCNYGNQHAIRREAHKKHK